MEDTSREIIASIIDSQDAEYQKGKEFGENFEISTANHAAKIVDILKKSSYNPMGNNETALFESTYQEIYSKAVGAKYLADLADNLIAQTDAALDYISKIDDARFRLIGEIKRETDKALEEAKSVTVYEAYVETIEDYVKALIEHIRAYMGLKEAPTMNLIPKTVRVTVYKDETEIIKQLLPDTIRRIHNNTVGMIIGINIEEE